jgi:hypothetical protein
MTLAWAENPGRVEAHYPTGDCACGAGLDGAEVVGVVGVARSHQSHDMLPIMAVVVQHDLYRVRCGCGRCHVADRPAGLAAGPVSYGENLRALALYLLVRQHLPVERPVHGGGHVQPGQEVPDHRQAAERLVHARRPVPDVRHIQDGASPNPRLERPTHRPRATTTAGRSTKIRKAHRPACAEDGG